MKKVLPWAIVGILVIGVVFTWLQLHNRKATAESDTKQTVDDSGNSDGSKKQEATPAEKKLDTKGGPAEKPEAIAAAFFNQAMKTDDPAARAELCRKAIDVAPTSDVAVQAAAVLGEYYYKSKETSKAVEYLQKALAGNIDEAQRKMLREKLDELTSTEALTGSVTTIVVKQGDRLEPLGRRYDIPYQLIMKMNDIKNPNLLRLNQTLRVIQGPFHVVIEKSKFKLSVYLGDKYVKSYNVGLGKESSTPEGEFLVANKSDKPVWTAKYPHVQYGDPENPLGTRWIGFDKEYGIHGTWEPDSIGKQASKGCVRMLNKDVEELFDFLVPRKSKVTIKP